MTRSPMDKRKIRTYLFSYFWQGNEYGMEVKAYSLEEAKGRVKQMSSATYKGEAMLKIPVPFTR